MVRTPHYYKNLINNVNAQVLYFRAVADQAKIPLMIYNWPQATGVDIAAEAVVLLGNSGKAHNTTAKNGLVGLTRVLARELAENGIRVNCVSPGSINTTRPSHRSERGSAKGKKQGDDKPRGPIPMKNTGRSFSLDDVDAPDEALPEMDDVATSKPSEELDKDDDS